MDDSEKETEKRVFCKHCGTQIQKAKLIGFSVVCPHCGKPQNGHQTSTKKDTYHKDTLMCKHCGNRIDSSKLRGMSLLCPRCNKPQNGQPKDKTVDTQ